MATKKPIPAAKKAPSLKRPKVTKPIEEDLSAEALTEEDIPTRPPEVPSEEPEAVPPKPQKEGSAPPPEASSEAPVEVVPPKPKKQGSGPPPAPAPAQNPEVQVDKERFLSFIEEIIDTLTFRRVSLIALLTVVGLGLFALWENRTELIGKIIEPRTVTLDDSEPIMWELSEKSKEMLQNFAKQTPAVFISITDVDLRKNRRAIRYYYIDDPTLILEPNALRAIGLPQPFFDYDPKNTAQMVAILSNEFKCVPYEETINHRFAPELASRIPVACRIAMPPFVGKFVGFLTVGLERQVDASEMAIIRLEASRLAVEIYLSDVMKKVN